MNCPFCYIPFNKEKPDYQKTLQLVDKCANLGVKIITIGGGDPFNYPYIFELVKYIKKASIKVHIDSNILTLKNKDLIHLSNSIDLLGIPIDGSNELLHNSMRVSNNHFNKIIKTLDNISLNNEIPIKINTLLSQINKHDMGNILDLISRSKANIKIWSIYQFWPLDNAINSKELYEISEELFLDICNKLPKIGLKFRIEINPFNQRYGKYLFSSPNGELYIHNPLDINNYLFIGSIFEKDWINNLEKYNFQTTLRQSVSTRYISNK